MNNIEFSNACYEVLEILKYVKQEDLKKIPKQEIQILKDNANFKHKFIYDAKKDIKEQEISKMAKGIIAVYFYKYTVSEKQREKIKLKQEYDLKIKQGEKEENSYYDMFKPKIKQEKISLSEDKGNQLVKYEQKKWYMRIFSKIKKILNTIIGK